MVRIDVIRLWLTNLFPVESGAIFFSFLSGGSFVHFSYSFATVRTIFSRGELITLISLQFADLREKELEGRIGTGYR